MDTRLSMCAAVAASWTARFSCRVLMGCIGSSPGNNQPSSPLGAGLNRVEPAAPRGAPKRLVLEAGWHRQPHRLKGQADRLAGTRDGQFQGEIHGVVGTAADQATLESSAGSGGEQHLPEVRRTNDSGEVKIAVRIPGGRIGRASARE